ncbi:hypothetical protein A5821_001822 [Enterococcus sp. 7F3_DIV0205]|uniref:Uncharacterized protein n=1 Tax=Candidatus Enterococcus palustris TaxID=1834189 RepID=A0AAQ3W9H1_9ENTE|nr:hypothetical protein A5821_002164 [Enterococcus sp. 7F3_DIV0205]
MPVTALEVYDFMRLSLRDDNEKRWNHDFTSFGLIAKGLFVFHHAALLQPAMNNRFQ